jgi:hypothetical protein
MKLSSESTDKSPHFGKVYFVRRSQYELPLGHRVIEFPSPNVLAWFQDNWLSKDVRDLLIDPSSADALDDGDIPIDGLDPIERCTHRLLGKGLYGFNAVWEAMAKWGDLPPQNIADLKTFVASIEYYGEITFAEDALQCVTDDDEIEISWLLFDGNFAASHPDRVAFLLHADFRLGEAFASQGAATIADPSRDLTPSRRNAIGELHCVFLSSLDGETLGDITGSYRFEGVRLPDFAVFLRSQGIPIEKRKYGPDKPVWPEELILLRALAQSLNAPGLADLLNEAGPESINERLSPTRAFSDFRYAQKIPNFLTGDREACLADFAKLKSDIDSNRQNSQSVWIRRMRPAEIQSSKHFCQIRFHKHLTPRKGHDVPPVDYTWRYLFFDDLWVAENPIMAQSILNYASGWKVLYDAEPIGSK